MTPKKITGMVYFWVYHLICSKLSGQIAFVVGDVARCDESHSCFCSNNGKVVEG